MVQDAIRVRAWGLGLIKSRQPAGGTTRSSSAATPMIQLLLTTILRIAVTDSEGVVIAAAGRP